MESATDVAKVAFAFAEAWNRHDMQALFGGLYTEDADFVNVLGMWWKGRERIEREHAARHADVFRNSTLTILENDVRFLRPDVVASQNTDIVPPG